jgi:hypothetical protein
MSTSKIIGLSDTVDRIKTTLDDYVEQIERIRGYHCQEGRSDKVYWFVAVKNAQNLYDVVTYWGRNGIRNLRWSISARGKTLLELEEYFKEADDERRKKKYVLDMTASNKMRFLLNLKRPDTSGNSEESLEKVYQSVEQKNALLL